MAWICLVESEVFPSHYPNGLKPFATVKTTSTLKQFSFVEWLPGNWIMRQSGMTLTLSPDYGSPTWISFPEVSPVRTSVVQELESAWAASEVVFSSTSQGLSAKQTRDLYFSKTSQQLELVASMVSSKHLPSSGMIVGGQLYQPKKLEPVTCESAGSCLPTATATAYGHNQGGAAGRKGKRRMSLESMASRGLIPTPLARDCKGPGGASRESPDLPFTMGGPLNPSFVEEIMGYHIGATALEDWATAWFRSKRKQRSKD